MLQNCSCLIGKCQIDKNQNDSLFFRWPSFIPSFVVLVKKEFRIYNHISSIEFVKYVYFTWKVGGYFYEIFRKSNPWPTPFTYILWPTLAIKVSFQVTKVLSFTQFLVMHYGPFFVFLPLEWQTRRARSEKVAASKQKYAFDTKSSFLQLFQGWPKHLESECANKLIPK